jgi:nitroreductase
MDPFKEDEMSSRPPNLRSAEAEVDSMFIDRWSPRAFLPDPLPEHQIQTLFEAARWAPSCFNEQPWLFLYATHPEDRKVFASILVKRNQLWASQAPLLIFAIASRKFKQSCISEISPG